MVERVTQDEIARGDDVSWTFSFEQSDGSAEDVTGWTLTLTIKTSHDDADADAAVQKSFQNTTDPTGGEIEASLTATETAALEAERYHYDFQVEYADGTVETLLIGRLPVIEPVNDP